MRVLVFGIVIAATVACRKPTVPPPASEQADGLAALREPVADPLRGRFAFRIESEPLGLKGGTGGALIVDRPGRLHFAVLGPLGGALATAQTDGQRASIVFRRDNQHLWADAVDDTVRGWTGGELGVDDVVGLFLGKVPLPASPADLVQATDGSLSYERSGDDGAGSVLVELEGTPLRPRAVRIVDAAGTEQLAVQYEGFEAFDAGVLPSAWVLSAPALQLQLDVTLKSVEPLDEAPDVFDTSAPEGFSSARWEDVAGRLVP